MAKEDLRITKTKQSIRKAFLELCQKKTVSKITVTELAQLAMINKGTFYLHYEDIYALYREVVIEICVSAYDHIDDFSLLFSNPIEFVRRWYAAGFASEIARLFPHFSPNELGIQVPAFLMSEFKKRIYDTGILDINMENDIRIECLICDLIIVSSGHYRNNPEATVKTMAEIISKTFCNT